MDSQIIALIACRRTGSNYLMKVLDSFSNIDFFAKYITIILFGCLQLEKQSM